MWRRWRLSMIQQRSSFSTEPVIVTAAVGCHWPLGQLQSFCGYNHYRVFSWRDFWTTYFWHCGCKKDVGKNPSPCCCLKNSICCRLDGQQHRFHSFSLRCLGTFDVLLLKFRSATAEKMSSVLRGKMYDDTYCIKVWVILLVWNFIALWLCFVPSRRICWRLAWSRSCVARHSHEPTVKIYCSDLVIDDCNMYSMGIHGLFQGSSGWWNSFSSRSAVQLDPGTRVQSSNSMVTVLHSNRFCTPIQWPWSIKDRSLKCESLLL